MDRRKWSNPKEGLGLPPHGQAQALGGLAERCSRQGQSGPGGAFLSWWSFDLRPMGTDTAPVDTAPAAADDTAAELDPRALTLANVERTLDELRPYLMADGGNVEVVEIDGPIVKVRLQGACGSCPSSTMTLKMGIERKLREAIPEVDEVVQVL